MSSAICIGSILAFTFGSTINWNVASLECCSYAGVALFLLWIALGNKICVLVTTWSFLWISMHSPSNWKSPNRTGVVLAGSGCANSDDDLLVSDNSQLFLAKGRAKSGDIVRSISNFFPESPSQIDVIVPEETETRFCQISNSLRSILVRRFKNWPDGERQWLESFVLGISSRIDKVTFESLKYLGLLHIVVLSGSHLTLISSVLLFLLRLVPLAGYCSRILTMRSWPLIWRSSSIIASFLVLFFSFAVGFGQSLQRSLIIFLICNILPDWLLNIQSSWKRLRFAWSIQCIFFPINLWSLSNFLTWTGTIILVSSRDETRDEKLSKRIFGDFKIQCQFGILAFLVFSQSGLVQIVANLIFCPIFALVLILNIWVLIVGPEYVSAQYIVKFQNSILTFVRHIALVAKSNKHFTFSAPEWLLRNSPYAKAITVLLLIGLVLKLSYPKKIIDN